MPFGEAWRSRGITEAAVAVAPAASVFQQAPVRRSHESQGCYAGTAEGRESVLGLTRVWALIHEAGENDEWDCYVIHDSLGVSHVCGQKKGEPPTFSCRNCTD